MPLQITAKWICWSNVFSIQQKKAKSSVIIRLLRFLQKAEHQSRKRRHWRMSRWKFFWIQSGDYQYNGNNVEFCVKIVKQEAADGQGEAANYMVIFAKRHDGEEGGGIWMPPVLWYFLIPTSLYKPGEKDLTKLSGKTKNASEFLLKRFLFKSATTYFHAPFPANYLRHKWA